MHKILTITGLCLLMSCFAFAQKNNQPYIYGKITDSNKEPVIGATVKNLNSETGTITDVNGEYKLYIPADVSITIQIRSVGYKMADQRVRLSEGDSRKINIELEEGDIALPGVTVTERSVFRAPSITKIPPKLIENLPSTSGNIENILPMVATGVSSTNELSSQYSVRGGNFDENLVYVNDFEVFRPFLIRSGQQEGLSFINPDLVSGISFSSGGFEAKYGDKMASVLDVKYKQPTTFKASAMLSLLGVGAHLEGASKDRKFTYLLGVRHKNNQYLLNALPTDGQYRPSFSDFQSFVSYRINSNWEIQLIANYARNLYQFRPVESETSFGTFNESLKLQVFFDGQESDSYKTAMGGLGIKYNTTENDLTLKLLTSAYRSQETEAFDIIGQYWIGEVETDFGNENFGDFKRILGVGTYHDWARNQLNATIANVEHRGLWDKSNHFVSWGVKYQHETITDQLDEWYRLDSAGYSLPYNGNEVVLADRLKTNLDISSNRVMGFAQDEWVIGEAERMSIVGGVRFNYWDLNGEFLVTPRLQIALHPTLKRNFDTTHVRPVQNDLVLRLATGAYYQPAFYREMRNFDGILNTNLQAQKSWHIVLGADYTFNMWQRPFKLTTELYYKHLWEIVPYDLDNLLIRYFGENNGTGYVAGLDLRLNGEFVPGIESWIGLSVMQARENLNDDYEYFDSEGETVLLGVAGANRDAVVDSMSIGALARPTDQRVNFSMLFQDYLPNNENFKMHLKLIFSTGLPFSPANTNVPQWRNTFRIPPYRRIDIGFSALLFDGNKKKLSEKSAFRYFESIWATLEIFNLIGVENTISYNWIRALDRVYGVPNYLTSRRVNVRLVTKF